VGNGGARSVPAKLTLFYNNGRDRYEIKKRLVSEEQIWINIGDLIRNQIPDENGKVLPIDATSGAFRLEEPGNVGIGNLFEGKLILDRTYGNAVYGCMVCCAPAHGNVDFNPLGVALASDAYQSVTGIDACTGFDVDMTGEYTTWWTGNTAIATATMNRIHGVAAGSTPHYARGTFAWGDGVDRRQCPTRTDTTSGNTIVGDPDHLRVVVDTNGVLADCPTVEIRRVTFQVVDNLETPVTYAPVQENFFHITTNTCGNGTPNASPCTPTDGSGRFIDTMTINCGGVGGPPHCGYDLTDHWEWCPSGKLPKNVGTLFDVTHIDAITVNSVTTPNKMPPPVDIYPQ